MIKKNTNNVTYLQPATDLLLPPESLLKEYYELGINGICKKYPTLTYNICREKLLKEGVSELIKYNKPELFIKEFLDANNITYVSNTKKIIPPHELDFYISSHNLAIEVCGLYWHRHSLLQNSKYHIEKLEACLKQGIQLVTIFSDHIESHPDKVLARLKFKLKLIPRMFHPRELHITDTYSKKDVNKFIDEYHLQGAKSAPINIVATHNGYICAAMTFGPLRRSLGQTKQIANAYEMYRFTSMSNIPGIASKLFKFFVNTYNPESIISFSDRCWGDGELYQILGFEKTMVNGANYWYTKNFISKIHRFGFTKHSLVAKGHDKNLTESQIMINLGYDKIYDCGSVKYSWAKPKQLSDN